MEFFIDEKTVTEAEFKEKVFSQLYINVAKGISNFVEADDYAEFLKLSPLNQTLVEIGVAKREARKYLDENEFEINSFRFKKEV
jgi:hypothetical protein